MKANASLDVHLSHKGIPVPARTVRCYFDDTACIEGRSTKLHSKP